jgi:hypothetical protein
VLAMDVMVKHFVIVAAAVQERQPTAVDWYSFYEVLRKKYCFNKIIVTFDVLKK